MSRTSKHPRAVSRAVSAPAYVSFAAAAAAAAALGVASIVASVYPSLLGLDPAACCSYRAPVLLRVWKRCPPVQVQQPVHEGGLSLLPMQAGVSSFEKKQQTTSDRRRKGRDDRPDHPKNRKLSGSKEQKGSKDSKAKAARICSLYLTTTDQLQCRYAVKNDEKESNQALPFVQANGYVEYKARYCKKRGSQSGYGNFHVAFVPSDEIIYPFMTSEAGKGATASSPNAADASPDGSGRLLHINEIAPSDIDRIEITVRLYQSFRGKFPVRLARFGPDEMYHPLYVDSWQDATLLRGMDYDSKMTVVQDPDGAYIKYIVQDPDSVQSFTTREGIVFPCPVPTHPERLNDIGMLRMQVTMQISKKSQALPETDFNVWIKMKVVQQLSGKKRKFTNMLRPASHEWCLPKHPEFTAVNASPQHVLHHVLGAESLQGQNAVDLFLALAGEITKRETFCTTSAFHIAAASGNLGIVRLMLQHELSLIRKRNPEGLTPLHLASMNGHTSIVQALLLAGARLETLTYQGETAADLAKLAGFDSLAHFLTAQAQKEQSAGCDNVFRAAAVGRTACLQRHLEGRAVVNSCNPEGQTPLMLAALNNHPFAVSTLLDHGADMFIPNRQGDTVLLQAAQRGFVDLVAILLEYDPAALKTVTKDGSTALHRSGEHGHVLTTQILISCGADINSRDAAGRTALDLAIANNHTCTAAVLDSAAATSPQKAILVSTTAANQTSGSLHKAAENGDCMLVRRLLRAGAHPNMPNMQGDSPIKLSAKRGQFLVLDNLITQHLQTQSQRPEWSEINTPGSDGDSPLHAACTHGSIASLLVLLSSNAVSLNIRAMGGDTALHRAAEIGLPVCAAFLMLAGADAHIKNNSGETPLDVARKLHHGATVQVLSVTRKELVAVSQALDKKPGIPTGRRLSSSEASEQSKHAAGVFKWKGLDDVLSRIWHGTHEVRTIARYIKLEDDTTSSKDGKRLEQAKSDSGK